jgi:hypothetical protein
MKHLILNNLNFVVTNYENEVEYNKDDFEISIFHYSSLLEQRHNMVIYNSNRIIKKKSNNIDNNNYKNNEYEKRIIITVKNIDFKFLFISFNYES